MKLFDEFVRLTRELGRQGISYAVVGGLALAFLDRPRFTRDIDLLVPPGHMARTRKAMKVLGYFESARPRTFRSTPLTLHRFMKTSGKDHITVDILMSRHPRYREIVSDATEQPCADGMVKVAAKKDIIWMKQQRGSGQDKVDIGKLRGDKD